MRFLKKFLIVWVVVLIICITGCSSGKHYNEFVNGIYYDENGNKIINNWKEISGNWYYFDGEGYMQKNKWIDDYYVDENGIMLKNTERIIGNTTYIFSADGIGKEKPLVELIIENHWQNPMWDTYGDQYVNISNINCYCEKDNVNYNSIVIVLEMDVEVLKLVKVTDATFRYRILDENGMLLENNRISGLKAQLGDKYHVKKRLLGRNVNDGEKYILQLY